MKSITFQKRLSSSTVDRLENQRHAVATFRVRLDYRALNNGRFLDDFVRRDCEFKLEGSNESEQQSLCPINKLSETEPNGPE